MKIRELTKMQLQDVTAGTLNSVLRQAGLKK